ncbi:hypothetical protein KY325_05270, partial [Candidatus Woesearchaeota archaeon]|nr:hypothetical protein [Candidatus Woesearchaeota archaeon]
MSVDFRILMNDIFLNPKVDLHAKSVEGKVALTNDILNKFFETEIDLIKVVDLARESAQGLYEELQGMYDAYGITPEYTEMPKNKELLVMDAQNLIEVLGEKMSLEDRQLLQKRIELFNKMQQQLRWLFSFDEGTLIEFVQMYIATAGMFEISDQDKQTLAIETAKEYFTEYAEDNAAYVEPRTSVKRTEEDIRKDMAQIILGYKLVKGERPDMRAVIALVKGIIQNAKDVEGANSEEARAKSNADKARFIVNMLKRAIANPDEIYLSDQGQVVTGRDMLHYFAGIDIAGQEEFNPPKIFFEVFNIIDDYNRFVMDELTDEQIFELGIPRDQLIVGKTTHVGEGFTDVSVESGIRHGFEALYNDQLTEDNIPTKPKMQRLGHLIAPAVNLDQFLGQTRTERISERIDQIKFDLALLKMGIPLISVTEAGLRAELADLEKKDPTDSVEITYTPEMITDLKIRAGFLLDKVIKAEAVVETNPTSNVGIGPISSFKDHTLNIYKDYTYGKWIEWVKADLAGNNIALAKLQAYEDDIDTELTTPVDPAELPKLIKGKLIKATINTDDLTMFGTTLSREIYIVAEALDIPIDRLLDMMKEGFNSRIGWRTLERTAEVEQAFKDLAPDVEEIKREEAVEGEEIPPTPRVEALPEETAIGVIPVSQMSAEDRKTLEDYAAAKWEGDYHKLSKAFEDMSFLLRKYGKFSEQQIRELMLIKAKAVGLDEEAVDKIFKLYELSPEESMVLVEGQDPVKGKKERLPQLKRGPKALNYFYSINKGVPTVSLLRDADVMTRLLLELYPEHQKDLSHLLVSRKT